MLIHAGLWSIIMTIGTNAALISLHGNRFGIGIGAPGAAPLLLDGNIISNPFGTAPELHGNMQQSAGTTYYNSVSSGVTALAGGGQSAATSAVIQSQITVVTTVATTSDSLTLPVAKQGDEREVFNQGANSMAIFPSSGAGINALAANASFAAATSTATIFIAASSTQWYTK